MRLTTEAGPVGFKACFFLVPPRVAVLPKSRVQLASQRPHLHRGQHLPPGHQRHLAADGQPVTQA